MTPKGSDVSEPVPESDRRPTAEEAFERYREAVAEHGKKLDRLYGELIEQADLMRVLHLVYLGVGHYALRDMSTAEARLAARAQGWIAGSGLRLTLDGLLAWWEWKDKIDPYLREQRFQKLWREVIGW